jgi:hypothetical protein
MDHYNNSRSRSGASPVQIPHQPQGPNVMHAAMSSAGQPNVDSSTALSGSPTSSSNAPLNQMPGPPGTTTVMMYPMFDPNSNAVFYVR